MWSSGSVVLRVDGVSYYYSRQFIDGRHDMNDQQLATFFIFYFFCGIGGHGNGGIKILLFG